MIFVVFFFKQKTAYEMRISDWSSDVCSSDLMSCRCPRPPWHRKQWEQRASDTGFVFSSDGKRPISDMTMTKALRDEGVTGATVHGFRSPFTDWAAETTNFPKEVADKAMAHKLPNQVEAA